MKTVTAIRHVAFEDLGTIAPALEERGFKITYHDAGVSDPGDPSLREAMLLIVLGGPMSVNDSHPYLKTEIEAIQFRLEAARPTLGICLGAQLIAKALGARVYPAPRPEIGWSTISLSRAGNSSPLRTFQNIPVFHWHNEIFDLPPGGIGLASTRTCPNQAFAIARRALGLQFHPEVTAPGLEEWSANNSAELSAPALHAETKTNCENLALHTGIWLSAWLEHVGLR